MARFLPAIDLPLMAASTQSSMPAKRMIRASNGMGSSFKNFVIDALDRFNGAALEEDCWQTAHELLAELGGNAMAIGAIDIPSGAPNWVRTSMREDFLARYVKEGYYEGDPFVAQLRQSMAPMLALPGTLSLDERPGDRSYARTVALNHALHDAGYRTIHGVPLVGASSNERLVVAFCSDFHQEEIEGGDSAERIRTLLTLIGAFINRPEEKDENFALRIQSSLLTPREQEILQLLAGGHRNNRIAARLSLSEIMVRKHAQSARNKLGAATRDQALVIALKRGLISL